MRAYTSFAHVYDTFMDNIPYETWSQYLISLLKMYGIDDGIVLDMGCGTGNITEWLAKAGYDMIGIDNSEDMLMTAAQKSMEARLDIMYLEQDMRSFELYGTVRAAVSICDSMNYILKPDELLQVFKLVNNYLDPEGLFIFDMNTEYKYKELMGDSTIAENRDDCSFIWDNYYDEETKLNTYELNLFIRDEEDEEVSDDGMDEDESYGEPFRRFSEIHYQRAYRLEEIKELLEKAGLVFVAAYDAFTMDEPKPDSERIYIIAKEHGKSEKLRLMEEK